MGNYTPKQIDDVFARPLLEVAKKLHRSARRLAKAIRDNKPPYDFVPLTGVGAEKKVLELEDFADDVELRIKSIIRGTYRWQEKQKEKQRQEYRQKKKPPEKKKSG